MHKTRLSRLVQAIPLTNHISSLHENSDAKWKAQFTLFVASDSQNELPSRSTVIEYNKDNKGNINDSFGYNGIIS